MLLRVAVWVVPTNKWAPLFVLNGCRLSSHCLGNFGHEAFLGPRINQEGMTTNRVRGALVTHVPIY